MEQDSSSRGQSSSKQISLSNNQKSDSEIPSTNIPNRGQFLSDSLLSSSENQTEDEHEVVLTQQQQEQKRIQYNKFMEKMNKTLQETAMYVQKMTEESTEVIEINDPIPPLIQKIVQIWNSRPIKKPKCLLRLALINCRFPEIQRMFQFFPSIKLSINGKVIQNPRQIYMQNDVYYEGDEQWMTVYSYENQESYTGGYKDKKYNGHGLLVNKTMKFGFQYQGQFLDGKFHGKGQYRLNNNNTLYVGDFKNDLKHGIGEETTFVIKKKKNNPKAMPIILKKNMYKGEFQYGQRQGKGLQITPTYKYQGLWRGGVKLGEGQIEFANGDQYKGNFQNNQFHGIGKNIEKDNCTYEGEFLNGKYHGKGKIVYQRENGEDVYQGDFQFGKKHGQGVYNWADGDYYDGNWINDSAEGQGTSMIGTDFYDGEFKNGVRHGEGTLTDEDGQVIRAIWQDGKSIKVIERNGQIVEQDS